MNLSDNVRKKIITACVLTASAILLGVTGFYLFRSGQYETSYTFELGDSIDPSPENYLYGGPVAMFFAESDFTDVNINKPGTYEMRIKCPGKLYTYEINLEDTTSPEINPVKGPYYFEQGSSLSPFDFLKSVSDADKNTKVSFDETFSGGMPGCDELGEHTALIIAEDTSGNRSELAVDYIVDIPPEIFGAKDYYIAAGSPDTILEFVSASDNLDGDISDLVTYYSSSELNFDEVSEQAITFYVSDSYGFSDSKTVLLHIMDAEDIQDMICSHEISRLDQNIIGAYNVYDPGLFEGQTIEETMKSVLPSVVNIRAKGGGTTTTGSGFIAEITDEYIYIITNRHVITKYSTCTIYFHTGDFAEGEKVGVTEDYDVGVIRVPLSSLPDDFTDRISTVHIDMTYWETLDDEPIELGFEKMDEAGLITHYTYGSLVKKQQRFSFFQPHIQTEMVLPLVLGDSGSAVFDKEGRIICMTFAYSIYPERDWGVPLDEVINAYREITGRELYTY